jgi:DNA modification methylase
VEIVRQRYIERFPIAEVVPDPDNPWQGDDEGVGESIDALGFYGAILLQEGTFRLVAGHTRIRQAQARGAECLPALIVEVDDLWQARALVGDNRTNQRGRFLDEPLSKVLGRLRDADALAGTGFVEPDLRVITGRLDATARAAHARNAPDDAPPVPEVPRTVVGDVWRLGPHLLVCGDCTDPEVVKRATDGRPADMVWTDPPYGVNYVGGYSHAYSPEQRRAMGGGTVENDELSPEALGVLLGGAFDAAVAACAPGAVWFVAAPAGPLFGVFGQELAARGIWRQTLVWLKDSLVMGRSDYHYRHEALFFGWLPNGGHHRPPDRVGDTIWEVARPKRSDLHPTMKPVALVARAVENHTDPGDLVLDPFAGSGTTLIASHDLGRAAALVDVDPAYCDVICRRFQEHTGEAPVREGVAVDFTEERDGTPVSTEA